MLEAKNTILSDERRTLFRLKAQKAVEDYYRVENPNNYGFVPKWLDEHAKQLCQDVGREELEAQAEITAPIFFEEGYKAGIKKVMEWIKSHSQVEHCDPDVMAYFSEYRWIDEEAWQAFIHGYKHGREETAGE